MSHLGWTATTDGDMRKPGIDVTVSYEATVCTDDISVNSLQNKDQRYNNTTTKYHPTSSVTSPTVGNVSVE